MLISEGASTEEDAPAGRGHSLALCGGVVFRVQGGYRV